MSSLIGADSTSGIVERIMPLGDQFALVGMDGLGWHPPSTTRPVIGAGWAERIIPPMTALLILNYDITDPERLNAYREAAGPVLVGPAAGELLASTDRTVHLREAGRPAGGTHTVVLRFRDAEQAHAVYSSARYQELLAERLAATVPVSAMNGPELEQ